LGIQLFIMGVRIYPVVEAKDFVYGHRYGWLDALLQSARGFMLRPEPELGKAFAARLTLRQYLQRRYGVQLDGSVIMMDHGIMSQSFSEAFGLAKTPKNIVYIYKVLGVDCGIAYDVPVRLCLQTKCGDPEAKRAKTAEELSRLAVEVGARRLREMAEEAERVGFQGLVPVVQGLSRGDVEYSAEESVRIMAERWDGFTVAVGTGGRALSQEDVSLIRYAVYAVEKYAAKYSAKVKIHLLGWSSPDRIRDVDLLQKIYSADSLTPRRRAVEGKAYVIADGRLELVSARELANYSCGCPACAAHKEHVSDPSGRRRNDVRMTHNVFVLQQYLASITAEHYHGAKPDRAL
jgi:queuine/archaeosine tRNA-ribosyltransferase